MIIADTNVVSEFMRLSPDPAVMAWAATLSTSSLTISSITVEEIEYGIRRLPPGRRQTELQRCWEDLLTSFEGVVAVYDVDAAFATGELLAQTSKDGHSIPRADAQIAGICLAQNAQLATRNVADFTHVQGLEVFNPFGN